MALDGSPLAEETLGPASELAQILGAGLTLVQVIEPPNPAFYSVMGYVPPEAFDVETWREESKRYLDQVAAPLRSSGLHCDVETAFDYPAATIARIAAEKGADAIVMATHGRTGLARAFMGSVANGVLQRAEVPVLVVRPKAMRVENT